MTDEKLQRAEEASGASFSEPIRAVLDALAKLRFGAIQLTVHEGKLVQVDVTERKRFTN
ncbi:MAG: YezD family protein [Sphingomonadaceae bacterium]|nr:YezD family protein [Sphingomonadaceae bacterium]